MSTATHPILGKHHHSILVAIWAVAIFLIALTGLHVHVLLDENYTRQTESTRQDLANLTRVTQEHANRTLRSADQAIRFVSAAYLAQGKTLNLTELSQSGVIDTEIFNQVGVIDERGLYILANRPVTGRLDLSDREHFKVHIANDSAGLFISKPVLGRATQKWSIQLTRRITRSNGAFAGVVVISIDPGYFTRFYSDLHLGPDGVAALYGLDGVARARKVGDKEEFGSAALNSQMFTRIAQGEPEGSYATRSVVDQVERTYYFRRIPQYPLAVTIGMSTAYSLADYVRSRNALIVQGILLALLIVTLATALTRYLTNMRKAIAAREFAQNQVQDRNEQLQAIFALSPDGFVSLDQFGRVKFVNPAFASMVGLGEQKIEGMAEPDFVARLQALCAEGASTTELALLQQQTHEGKPGASTVIELAAEGRRVLQVGLRNSQSATVSRIYYFRDITHETAVDEMKSEFLSTAAHELRTPMASILGFCELLLIQRRTPEKQQEFLNIIHAQSKVMSNILNELLDLARIEARRGKDFRYTRVCLQDFLPDVAKSMAIPSGRSAPQLQLSEEPVFVRVDEGKLRQAVVNVLSNAYKYSPDGGAVHLEMRVAAWPDASPQVCLEIRDPGIGMTPEQLGRVFERFYRADSSGKIPGTGLGMSIVKEIMELQHGSVEVDSDFAQGTRVRLWLPADLQ